MDTRWLRRRMVLYRKRCVLLHSVPRAAIRSTHWLLRRAPELRFQEAAALDLARRQLLVWRRHHVERRTPSRYQADRLPHWGHSLGSHHQTSIDKVQLQRWHVHPVRRGLPESFGRVAILLDWKTEVAVVPCDTRSRKQTGWVPQVSRGSKPGGSNPPCAVHEYFGRSFQIPWMKRNGRHEETRTPDLYRVKFDFNNLKPFACLAFPI